MAASYLVDVHRMLRVVFLAPCGCALQLTGSWGPDTEPGDPVSNHGIHGKTGDIIMEPGIVWAIIMTVIAGLEIPATLLVTKRRHVEDQKDSKTIISELQGINRKISSLPRQPNLEERKALISSAQSISHTIGVTVQDSLSFVEDVDVKIGPDDSTPRPGKK